MPLVTISTTESELMSFVYGLQDALRILQMLRLLKIEPENKYSHCDNLPAINILKDESALGRTKHLDARLLFNRQYKDLYDKSDNNPADGFTKPLRNNAFQKWSFLLDPSLN